ncbi:MAG: hypothetical protein ACKVQK_01355 [Burkholderiales bacterium]
MVEGRRRLRFGDNDKVTGTTVNSRELLNPEERVRHMVDFAKQLYADARMSPAEMDL